MTRITADCHGTTGTAASSEAVIRVNPRNRGFRSSPVAEPEVQISERHTQLAMLAGAWQRRSFPYSTNPPTCANPTTCTSSPRIRRLLGRFTSEATRMFSPAG